MKAINPAVPSFLATDQHALKIVEQASDAIFVYDLDGRFVDANHAACALVGYTHDELLSLGVGDLEPSFDVEQGRKRWREMVIGEHVTVEGINRRKDGSVFPEEARVSVVETDGRRLLLALVRDISERKRAKDLLRLRARQQQALANLSAEALAGQEFNVLLGQALQAVSQTLNLELCRILEHVPAQEALVNRAGFDLPPEQLGQSAASDEPSYVAGYVLQTGEAAIVINFEEEHRFQRTPWLKAEHARCGMSVPIGSVVPRYGILAAYSRDLREFTSDDVFFVQAVANVLATAIVRRRSEDALREVEARYRRIAANTSGMVFQLVMKPDFSVTLPLVSEGCRQVYELEPAQLQANPELVHRLVHPADKEQYKEVLRRTVATEEPFYWEGRVLLRSGNIRWVTARAYLERQPCGDVIWDGVVLDVSALKQAQQKMLVAKEDAERANLAKSQFLSRMSHELRTPLNAILGFGQVLQLSPHDEPDEQCVEHILKGGRHLLSLIDEVLDLARVEAGELALHSEVTTFGTLMQECTGLVSKMAQARGITCTTRLGAACHLPIWADERRLRQVLLNLLSNAIKYGRQGGQVVLNCQKMPDERVRCSVEDMGLGISPEGLAKLFVPFERLGQELGDTEGLGLGLVVSRRLAEAMGGTLEAESQPDVGSTFWIEMPVMAAEDAEQSDSTASAMDPAPAVPVSASATVLYIEDNSSNLQVMQAVMQRMRPQWRLLSAKDGVSGLALAREQRPDVLLLDLELPGMKGDAVLAAVRADTNTADLPVLLLSADATAQSRERLMALKANDYVTKPFSVAELLRKLDGLIGRSI